MCNTNIPATSKQGWKFAYSLIFHIPQTACFLTSLNLLLLGSSS